MREHKIQLYLKGYDGLSREELESLVFYCYIIPKRSKRLRHQQFIDLVESRSK